MGNFLNPIFSLFRNHKLKMFMVLAIASAFFLILFPMDDLADTIATQVGRGSGAFVQIQNLGLSLNPGPSVHATDVIIEPAGFPPIKASAFQATIAVAKLFLARIGFNAQVEGLFHGAIDLDYGQGATTKSGAKADELSFKAEHMNLDDVCDYLRSAGLLTFRLQGVLNMMTSLRVDHGFDEQPSGTIKASLPQLTIPSQGVMLDMNGVAVQQQVPTIELGNVSLDAKLNEGVMEISTLKIGGPGKEINGTIKGSVGLLMQKTAQGVASVPSNLDLLVDFTVDKAFLDRNKGSVIGGFLMLIDKQFITDTGKGTRYALRLQMKQFAPGQLPLMSRLPDKI